MSPGREDLGSWLEGTPGRPVPDGVSGEQAAAGAGVRAGVGRRVAALAVDWVASLAVSALLWPSDAGGVLPLLAGDSMATLAVFAGSTVVLVGLLGHTLGHRLLGLRVVRRPEPSVDPSPGVLPVGPAGSPAPGLLAAAVRTALLCLVIPAVVWDRSGRGLHDVAARTAIVRR
ncbi:RDD family protein [Actinotalea sp.]|uniref:RDD family protein n=1 Tax=Actinotalea sp. TaxID=1872145 RepID=UPI002D17EC7E|nr:RDD family protein [Actinotalea sp.]HQY34871.1 RDD family protein [Actinotalea sp.]HRA50894.1 RDD family protein [Actinotalea sp.]